MNAIKTEDRSSIGSKPEERGMPETDHPPVPDEQIETHRNKAEDQHTRCKSREIRLTEGRRRCHKQQREYDDRRVSIDAQHRVTLAESPAGLAGAQTALRPSRHSLPGRRARAGRCSRAIAEARNGQACARSRR